MPSAAVINKAQ